MIELRALLIDDELPALENLRRKMNSIPEFEIVGMYQDERQALLDILSLRPDIVFLDIEMRFFSGLEFLEKVFDLGLYPKIVFVTAHSQYAQDAFELNAFDYIRKPVETERLLKTIAKIDFHRKLLTEDSSRVLRKEIYCFGELKFLYDKKEQLIKWRTKKVEELFLYLLCNHGRFIAKEGLVKVLWEEADMEKGLQYLYNALYNLKKIDGDFFSLETVKGKVRMNLGDTFCDISEVEDNYKQYCSGGERKLSAIKELKALYRGPLLSEYDYVWLAEYQSRFDKMWEKVRKIG